MDNGRLITAFIASINLCTLQEMKKPMSDIENELEALRAEFSAWLSANMPPKPDFMVPESFMEVGTEQQLEWLRAWQNKVYEA